MVQREKKARQVLVISLLSNVFLSLLKLIAGFLAKSQAVVADAVHSLSDVLSTVIALIGIKWSNKPADDDHHYGHTRIEAIASKFVAIVLIITALGLMLEAIRSLRNPVMQPPGAAAIVAAVISIVVKEIMFKYVYRVGKSLNSIALVSDAWHNRSDAFSSIGALSGVLLSRYGGYLWADSAAGLIVSILVLKVGFDIYKKSIQQLVDTAPDQKVMQEIRQICLSTEGVVEVDDMKARVVGPYIHLDLQIAVNPDITVKSGHDIAEKVEKNISNKVPNAHEIMVHVNPAEIFSYNSK